MSILFGCDIMPSFSAICFIKSPTSFLFATVFLKIGGKLAKNAFGCSGTLRSHERNQTAFDT